MQQKINTTCFFASVGRCEALRVVEFGCKYNQCKFYKTLGQQIYDEQKGRRLLGRDYKTIQEVRINSYADSYKGSEPVKVLRHGEMIEMWESMASYLNWSMNSISKLREKGYDFEPATISEYKKWVKENSDG